MLHFFYRVFFIYLEKELMGSNEPILQGSLKHTKQLFSPQEDSIIIDHVRRFGPKKWKICAQRLNHRTARQCCERYTNFLDPSISHSEWTIEEDMKLEEYVKKMGHAWSTISKYFEHRTPVNLKSRYKTNAHRYIVNQSEMAKVRHQIILPSIKTFLGDDFDYSIETFINNMNGMSNLTLQTIPEFHIITFSV